MKNAFLLLLLVTACTVAAHSKTMSLQQALHKKAVSVEAYSTGGLQASVCVRNLTCSDLVLTLEPALIFKPADTNYQDMVLLGGEVMMVAADSSAELNLKAYCGKSYARSPARHLAYRFWRQGNHAMQQAATFARVHALPTSLVQHAVWAFTNRYPVEQIYDRSVEKQSIAFATLVAKLLGQPAPQFFAKTEIRRQPDGRMVVTPMQHAAVFLNLDVPATRRLHIQLYDGAEHLLRNMHDYEVQNGGKTARVALNPKKLRPGTYVIRLRDDGNRVWEEKRIVIAPAART